EGDRPAERAAQPEPAGRVGPGPSLYPWPGLTGHLRLVVNPLWLLEEVDGRVKPGRGEVFNIGRNATPSTGRRQCGLTLDGKAHRLGAFSPTEAPRWRTR